MRVDWVQNKSTHNRYENDTCQYDHQNAGLPTPSLESLHLKPTHPMTQSRKLVVASDRPNLHAYYNLLKLEAYPHHY